MLKKRMYSIFFGSKAAKRKLSILKERWFDIANETNLITGHVFVKHNAVTEDVFNSFKNYTIRIFYIEIT